MSYKSSILLFLVWKIKAQPNNLSNKMSDKQNTYHNFSVLVPGELRRSHAPERKKMFTYKIREFLTYSKPANQQRKKNTTTLNYTYFTFCYLALKIQN